MKRLFVPLFACMLALCSVPALAAALTDFAENKIGDALLRGQTLTPPATWHLALSTDTCTDATAGAEPSGNGYARASIAASLANFSGTQGAGTTVASTGSGGNISNNTVISWPESTGAWGNLQSVQLFDAASGGNRWICINLTAPFNVAAAGVTVRFPAAGLVFQVDN